MVVEVVLVVAGMNGFMLLKVVLMVTADMLDVVGNVKGCSSVTVSVFEAAVVRTHPSSMERAVDSLNTDVDDLMSGSNKLMEVVPACWLWG